MSNIKNWILSIFKKQKEQRTFIYCECSNEMCSDNSFISDTYDDNGNNHVKYKCERCGKESDFNFDIAPIPINWNELRAIGTKE